VLRLRRRPRVEDVREPVVGEARFELRVPADERLDGGVEVRARLRAEGPERVLDPERVLPRLLEMLPERLDEPLAPRPPAERRQERERERPFGPQQLAEEQEEQVARVAQRGGDARFSFSSRASRSESAMITSAGFAEP
jgi:hypothetical protein